MKTFTSDHNKPYSFSNDDDDNDDNISDLEDTEQFSISCRKLTSSDVDRALNTLNVVQNSSQLAILSSDVRSSVICSKSEYDCCRLRRLHNPSRLSLPLARRGRSVVSTSPRRSLCSQCIKIKREQEIDILRHEQEKLNSNDTYKITINLDASPNKSIASPNSTYQMSQALIWNMNLPTGNTQNMSYDTGSLNETEKKLLLDETIRKLQRILNNQSPTTITETDQQNPEVTRRILQTTINILSSSQDSM